MLVIWCVANIMRVVYTSKLSSKLLYIVNNNNTILSYLKKEAILFLSPHIKNKCKQETNYQNKHNRFMKY